MTFSIKNVKNGKSMFINIKLAKFVAPGARFYDKKICTEKVVRGKDLALRRQREL